MYPAFHGDPIPAARAPALPDPAAAPQGGSRRAPGSPPLTPQVFGVPGRPDAAGAVLAAPGAMPGVFAGLGGGSASLTGEERTGSGQGVDREWPFIKGGHCGPGAAGWGRQPGLSPPGAQGGSGTADSGASAPRAAAALSPGHPVLVPGSRGIGVPRSCPLILCPTLVPWGVRRALRQNPPASGRGRGVWDAARGRAVGQGLRWASSRTAETSPELVLPVLLQLPAEMGRGVGKAERSGSPGQLCRAQGWRFEDRFEFPSLPPCSLPSLSPLQ